jgi:hypothetical protein
MGSGSANSKLCILNGLSGSAWSGGGPAGADGAKGRRAPDMSQGMGSCCWWSLALLAKAGVASFSSAGTAGEERCCVKVAGGTAGSGR